MEIEGAGRHVVDAAIRIHREVGPGLLESVYETLLAHELRSRELRVERQAGVPVFWRDLEFPVGFRADLIIEGLVIVEVKSVENLNNAHRKQLLTYLRLSGLSLGYLLNFGGTLMKDGIVRIVNNHPHSISDTYSKS